MDIVSEILAQLDRTEYSIIFELRYKKRQPVCICAWENSSSFLISLRNSVADPDSVIRAVKLGWLKIQQSLQGWEVGNELSGEKTSKSCLINSS